MTVSDSGRQIISLNGDDWRLVQALEESGRFPLASETIQADPAVVPGDVRLDLLHADRLPDPRFGRNSLAGQWVDEHDWWLIRDLDDLDLPSDQRAFLRLNGIDYLSEVHFNGHLLGRHEGMFSPQLYEITGLLAKNASEANELANLLAVRVTGAAHLTSLSGKRVGRLTRLRDRLEGRVSPLSRWPHRRSTIKCQMGFGWDFAPDLPSLGIWDDVDLILSGDVFIRDLWSRPVSIDDHAAHLIVALDLDVLRHSEVEIGLNLFGLNCDAPPLTELFPINLNPGQQRLDLELTVPEPCLWSPWDRGEPNLYRLLVTVRRRGELLDSLRRNVGLRQIHLEPNPGAPPDALPWVFAVNGQRVFLRGANWVPASLFPGQLTAEDYGALLELAREANLNALRVWGGGLREKAAFYDLCDQLGLLVWQEFPFACAFLTHHPHSDDYLALVEQETRAIVRTLRHHPSVILWCGGNEFNTARDWPLVESVATAVAAEDATRPFVSASPAGGDHHNWQVWHGFAPVSAYLQDTSQFASEFGLQAPPDEETLRQFIPEAELWPPGTSWGHHNADWPKLWHYAATFLDDGASPDRVTLDQFLAASQRAQALGLQIAIEHYRRRKYACGGCLVWQFNAPWPAIDWAIIDHLRRPKPAYQVVQRLYAPVLVSLEYPLVAYGEGSEFCPSVWIINDRPESLTDCQLVITLETAAGTPLGHFERTLDLAADRAESVASFCWTLPGGAKMVRCHLFQEDETLSFNAYDLSVHDRSWPHLWHRFRSWVNARLLGQE